VGLWHPVKESRAEGEGVLSFPRLIGRAEWFRPRVTKGGVGAWGGESRGGSWGRGFETKRHTSKTSSVRADIRRFPEPNRMSSLPSFAGVSFPFAKRP